MGTLTALRPPRAPNELAPNLPSRFASSVGAWLNSGPDISVVWFGALVATRGGAAAGSCGFSTGNANRLLLSANGPFPSYAYVGVQLSLSGGPGVPRNLNVGARFYDEAANFANVFAPAITFDSRWKWVVVKLAVPALVAGNPTHGFVPRILSAAGHDFGVGESMLCRRIQASWRPFTAWTPGRML